MLALATFVLALFTHQVARQTRNGAGGTRSGDRTPADERVR